MRKLSWIAAAGAVALTVTGVALAHGFGGRSAQAVGANFTATQVTNWKTWTCTNGTSTWARTVATYSGTASGDLAGPVRLRVESVIDGSHDTGVVEGALRIDTAKGHNTTARFTGAYQGGKVAGIAVGNTHDPNARLVANVSASFSPTGGFSNGKIGNSDGGAAIEVVKGSCKPAPQPKAVVRMDGQVTAASAKSLSVRHGKRQLTMSVPSSLAGAAAALHTGDHVRIVAARIDGSYVLVSLKAR